MTDWIKCSDRLPSKEDAYLVFSKKMHITIAVFNAHNDCWDDEFGDDYYCDAAGGDITHWMPLPEDPKE